VSEKILIANRGEIACRIIRTCKELGFGTVAIHSEADRDSMHVVIADEAFEVGAPPARESYLKSDVILEAAARAGARAVHPGYGFLSENAGFAQSVTASGMIWIGPSPDSIRDMGDKERAREIAREAGVPVLPGSNRFGNCEEAVLVSAAREIGFPLLVKAAAGGGGIGMRRCDAPEKLAEIASATQSMAAKSFGDASIYFERYVGTARHIEVQIFGFGDGTGVHLYDRDCSVQRRFQKIIEEAPAPGVPDAVRKDLYRASLALVAHQRYSGAGTVEFIYDCDREQAYFLEMNTRIQVEHPVTEMVTGIDLVAWQILHAFGRLQPVGQHSLALHGHAMECRLYAERPEKNFLPSPGTISTLRWPPVGEGLRIDTGIGEGGKVTPYYDPMIAKLIAHGETRRAAMDRLSGALDGMELEGLSSNREFLRRALSDGRFRAGAVDTGFALQLVAQLAASSGREGSGQGDRRGALTGKGRAVPEGVPGT
jgi:3-methylcrotonyl-CoA carboxylase alpha subunit